MSKKYQRVDVGIYGAVLVGAGKMGSNHVKVLRSLGAESSVNLLAVADAYLPSLLALKNEYPSLPLFLLSSSDIEVEEAQAKGINVCRDVCELVENMSCNTIINCTHNDFHIDVLKQALSVCDADGKPCIEAIFQEKPFTEIGYDMSSLDFVNVTQAIKEHNILFHLNAILGFSPVWRDYDVAVSNYQDDGFVLKDVYCRYGNDFLSDTRALHSGCLGTDAIHMLVVSTWGLDTVEILPETISHEVGYLNPYCNDGGDTLHAFTAQAIATNEQGKSVSISLESSMAWEKQCRCVQYTFENVQTGEERIIQLDFDLRLEAGEVKDSIVWQGKETVRSSSYVTNKLENYYKVFGAGVDGLYRLDQAIMLQKLLNALEKAEKMIHRDARLGFKSPTSYQDIRLQKPAIKVKKKNQPKHF